MHGTVAGDVAVCLPLNCKSSQQPNTMFIIIIWRLDVTVGFFITVTVSNRVCV